jgi:hypothetical protein
MLATECPDFNQSWERSRSGIGRFKRERNWCGGVGELVNLRPMD